MPLASTEELIAELRAGRMIILVDEEDRENEGDLLIAAEFVTAETINFMARFGRGLICLTLTPDRCRQLNLPLMVTNNGTSMGTNFTVSIEAAEGITTGISAADRAHTVRVAVARHAKSGDLVQPGHIFPLMAQPGGVLVRSGHTEAGCDLAALAGCTPAAVICEVMKDDGTMARLPDLIEFAKEHDLKIGTIVDLIHYRGQTESIIERIHQREMVTPWGIFQAVAYRDTPTGSPHLALIKGQPSPEVETLVRVHEPLSLLDVLDVGVSPHSWPIAAALEKIATASAGVMVMLNCHGEGGRDAGSTFLNRFSHPAPQHSPSRAKMNFRTYGIGAQILRDCGVGKMRVLSSSQKIPTLAGYDLDVVGTVSLHP
jgi:3,4-dihydroxy 2-butanone 4-phosphate synthase / GTP cyclohydrolase II